MSQSDNSSRRKFIQSLFFKMGSVGLAGLFVSRHAEAIEHLQGLPNPLTNNLQNNLLTEPKRQMLIAEDADCLDKSFMPTPKMKLKCLGGWSDM